MKFCENSLRTLEGIDKNNNNKYAKISEKTGKMLSDFREILDPSQILHRVTRAHYQAYQKIANNFIKQFQRYHVKSLKDFREKKSTSLPISPDYGNQLTDTIVVTLFFGFFMKFPLI